jgi:hypothetical protein
MNFLVLSCSPGLGLNHHPLNHQSNVITTTPPSEMMKSRCDQMDGAYLHIVMVIAQREQNRFNYISVEIYDY